MARKFLGPIDMTRQEIRNMKVGLIAGDQGTPVEGDFWYNSTTHLLKWHNGTAIIDPLARANHSGTQLAATISDFAATAQAYTLNQFVAPTADLSVNSHKLTNVLDPTGAQDAATKFYVDALIQGFSWKQFPVRVRTTAAGTLASSFANASVVDGVTLVTNDRILIMNQASGQENGIYTVNAAGAPTRAVDADTSAELVNATVWVSQGTTYADTAWTQTVNAPITVNTTALVFAQVGGGGSAYTGSNGILLTGLNFTAVVDPTPADLIVSATGLKTDPAKIPHIYSSTIGDGSTTSIVVTHNLNTRNVQVTVFLTASTYDEVGPIECQHTTVNTITLIFAVAPTAAQYTAVVHG